MIVTNDYQRLYLSSWNYNAARIISKLAEIVTDNNGRVEPHPRAIISNRHAAEAIRELTEKVENVKRRIDAGNAPETATAYYQENADQLARYQAINNEPITVTHTSYISFVLGDYYYYFQVDDNPFFPFHYQKAKIIAGTYSRDSYLTEDNKEWLLDCFFGAFATDAEIAEAAQSIYTLLTTANPSERYRESFKQKVPNTYNDEYHYETVLKPERFEKITF